MTVIHRGRLFFNGGYTDEREWVSREEHDAVVKHQASAALSGMDAAKATSSRQLELARQARAESSPDALESERQANAKLTQELSLAEERLANYAQENAQLRALLTQAPIAKVTVQETGWAHDLVTASLYKPGLPPGEHDLYLMPSVPQGAEHG